MCINSVFIAWTLLYLVFFHILLLKCCLNKNHVETFLYIFIIYLTWTLIQGGS